MAKVAPVLEDAPIFHGLPAEELAFLGEQITERRFRQGENLLEFGQEAPGLYVIRSGLVSAIVANETGHEREVATLGRGECVGEMALMTGEPCSATVRAMTDGEAWLIGREEFIESFERCPTLWRNLGRILSQRLVRTSRHLSAQAQASSAGLVFGCDDDESVALAVALASSVARQTGKKTLLVDARGKTTCPISTVAPVRLSPSFAAINEKRSMLKEHQAPQDTANGLHGARIADLAGENGDAVTEGEYLTVMEWLAPLYDFILVLVRQDGPLSGLLRQRLRSLVAVVGEPSDHLPGWLDGLVGAPGSLQELHVAMLTLDPRMSTLIEQVEDRTGRSVVRLPIRREELRSLPLAAPDAGSRVGGAIDRLARRVGGIQVGLALGAGAAKGFAHIGVLRVLEEAGVPIDCVAGCSIGAVVGGMYAGGRGLDEVEERMQGADRKLRRWTLPLRSLWSDAGLKELLRKPAPTARFRDLPVPFAVVATDVVSGREIVIKKGLAWRAVQASTSVPGIFPAALIHGRHLVDGGLVNPVPSKTARDLGADIVIAVDLMSPSARAHHSSNGSNRSEKRTRIPNLVEMLWRASEIMQEEVTLRSAATADITIEPRLGRVRWSDFSTRASEFIALGEEAAREKMPEIQRLLPYVELKGAAS